jgi:alpha-N-arabinofuranosidase
MSAIIPRSTVSAVEATVVLDEPVGTINPNVQGHFIEHLGACIYGGIWTGHRSEIKDWKGIRLDVIEALRAIKPPVLRWPGGCFADDYHWKDGVGPRHRRPRRVNLHWGDCVETNEFGTHEFIDLCRAIGAEPYLAGNLGSGSPAEMREWVEYCNYPSGTTLSDQRIENGASNPFGVKYWGVGNENWGCGGNMSAADYAAQYRRYATFFRPWGGTEPELVACGPLGNDLDWTRSFFEKLYEKGPRDCIRINGFAAHRYCFNRGEAGADALDFNDEGWYSVLTDAHKMEQLIVQQRYLMDEYDPMRKIGLIVDEWGAWHKQPVGAQILWQQNCIRDAMLAATTLDIFNRHADKIAMANIAQTVNVLQALILTQGDKLVKTPTYHVYDLYKGHQGSESLRLEIDSPLVANLPQVSGSASIQGGVLTVTLTNLSISSGREVRLSLQGLKLDKQATLHELAYKGGDVKAHNNFDDPCAVSVEQREDLQPYDGGFCLDLEPASIARITAQMG